MEDSSKDLPKPPRRTAARPFFSPRPSSGEGVTGPLELSRRRSAQLFTPPGASSSGPLVDRSAAAETEVAAKPTAAAASHVELSFEGPWTAAPAISPERTLDADSLSGRHDLADDDHLVVEMFEHEEIELTVAASDATDEHSIEVIAYDDANSLLKAAAADGKHPRVDGLQLETTEFSFEQEAPPPRMSVDSFWASEPFARTNEGKSHDDAVSNAREIEEADETESMIDEETAGEPVQAAEASAPRFADIAPPWRNRLTPVSSQALEELKESEPWDLAPSQGLEIIPEEIEASAPAAEARELAALDVEALEAEALEAEALEAEAVEMDATPTDRQIADALVRIAARVRAGELEVPAEAEMSDEAALSAVLTSLLRMRR
jgi:hypothetical protein